MELLKSRLPQPCQRINLGDLRLRTAQIFTDKEIIGEGTFGKVYKARIKRQPSDEARAHDENRYYALKMIKMDNDKEGFPITAMREIKLLKQLRHKNIVNLVEIVTSSTDSIKSISATDSGGRGQVYLVFDYAEHDL